jgi:hypothetical protein
MVWGRLSYALKEVLSHASIPPTAAVLGLMSVRAGDTSLWSRRMPLDLGGQRLDRHRAGGYADRRLNARLTGTMRSHSVIDLVKSSCAGMRPLPRVVPFWQAGLVQDCWGSSLAAMGLCPRSPRNCSASAKSNGLPSPNGSEAVNASRR